jgi:hypothetical protein
MNKNNKIVKILTEENKSEVIIFFIVSLVTLVLGILILTGYLNVKADIKLIGEYPKVFGGILVVIAGACVINSIFKIRKMLICKKNSVYYVIKEMEEETIKNKLAILSSDKIEIDNLSSGYYITLYYGDVSFNLEIKEDEVSIYIDGYYDLGLSEEEIEKLDNLSITLNSLKTNKDEVFSKFISFVNTNIDMVKSYGEKE